MIAEFIRHIAINKGYSCHTVQAYQRDITAFVIYVKERWPLIRWSCIKQEHIDEYVNELVYMKYSAATIKRRISAIRSLFTYARIRGYVKKNPAQYVSTPKKPKTLPRTVSDEEIQAAAAAATPQMRAIIVLISETGMRISEALGLRTQDVNPKEMSIRINGKGSKERIVRYGSKTREAMNAYLGRRRGMVFTDINQEQVRWEMRQLFTQTPCSPHVLRHTFASKMINGGANIEDVRYMLGHENIKTTQIYTHTSIKHISDIYNRIIN